jgi:hypothetical protein
MAEALGHIGPQMPPVRPEARPPSQPAPVAVPSEAKVAAPPIQPNPADDDAVSPAAALDNTKLTVSLDTETGTFIYRSVASTDGEVVWQWPSEQVMRVIQYFRRIESLDEKIAAKRSVDQKA